MAAGAPEVQLSEGQTTAINRLINGEVPAAVLALVAAGAADGYPEIVGFKIFRNPALAPFRQCSTLGGALTLCWPAPKRCDGTVKALFAPADVPAQDDTRQRSCSALLAGMSVKSSRITLFDRA